MILGLFKYIMVLFKRLKEARGVCCRAGSSCQPQFTMLGPSQPRIQPGESVTATADAPALGIMDVEMQGPPYCLSSQWGHAHTIKAIGSSSGASKPYGATICGRALGNAPNIGDFNAVDEDTTIDIEGTVNLFSSNT